MGEDGSLKYRYLKWYTKALNGIVGLFICIYAYATNDIILYNNISEYIDVVPRHITYISYVLLPMCIFLVAFSFIEFITSFIESITNANKYISWIGDTLSISILILGYISCDYYFLIFMPLLILTIIFEILAIRSDKKLIKNQKFDLVVDLLSKNLLDEFILDVSGITQIELDDIKNKLENKNENT